jgi:Zn-finger nucleic acid-binding protein
MLVLELEGIEIDRCVGCGGTWLDAGELEQIGEIAGIAPGQITAALAAAGKGQRGQRRCPRCGRKMHLVTLGTDEPVTVDQCPIGHGLWLDAGELRAVVRSFAGGEEGAVARFFGDMFRHDLADEPDGG